VENALQFSTLRKLKKESRNLKALRRTQPPVPEKLRE